MPGWHEKLKTHVENDEVVELGLIQEQHPDRCKLFMQWKQMDFPIMVDSLNLLAVKVVPITLFIDEHGVIRKVKPKHDDLAGFLAATYDAPKEPVAKASVPPTRERVIEINEQLEGQRNFVYPKQSVRWADLAMLWAPDQIDDAIAGYQRGVDAEPEDGATEFRLGVAYRKRSEGSTPNADDFRLAVKHWERSLEIDPNHYIRRRRIQQYGPRLDKPYSFYDWVNEARKAIVGRGEKPHELLVEPSGAEFAYPEEEFKEGKVAENPDAEGKIDRDADKLIRLTSVAVPAKLKAGAATRVHLSLQVNTEKQGHWNNEGGDSIVWVDAPTGWQLEQQLWKLPNGEGATSTEEREVEFELRAPKDTKAGKYTVKGYALYYVCEGVDGTCLYLRQDFELELEVS